MQSSGIAILLKSLGIDPAQIQQSISAFSQLAQNVQQTVAEINTRLENIELMCAEILKNQNGDESVKEVTALFDARQEVYHCDKCGKLHSYGECEHGRDAAS